jgi:transcriptional regulator with GAF, ATPase, and Fis domain
MAGANHVASELAALAGWELVRKAGDGASSVVWEGTKGGKRGAVKVLAEGFGLEEAELLARLDRVWGPALLDLGREGDRAFVVTEWAEGSSFGTERSGLGEGETWAIVHAVARALEELHEAGVRHGDVKPDNIVWHHRTPKRDVAEERAATLIDLGLATSAGEAARGGTAKYAAPELRSGGDVGPRADVFALGMILKELGVAGELARIAEAMCAPSPGARPSAAWVAERAARELGLVADDASRAAARVSAVRRVYLALRARDIAVATNVSGVSGKPREWLESAIALARKIQKTSAERSCGHSSPLVRARWIVGLVGGAAASWPVAFDGDEALADRLCALAERLPFAAWTFADLRGDRGTSTEEIADDAAIAIALARPHPPATLVERVERRDDAPGALKNALADALVRAGELARAMLVLEGSEDAESIAKRADVARRLGDADKARALAGAAKGSARAAAVLARIAWDAGDDAAAARALASHRGSAVAEVAALVACRKGAFADALKTIDEALVDETDAVAAARLHGTRGWVDHTLGRADASLADYARAVDLASRAGAVADEATYLAGEAAAATDAGDVGRACTASTRAAVLLERLGRLREASRAWLVRAAALATIGDVHGADEAALEIASRSATDPRTRSYARWARVEPRPEGDAIASAEAKAALAELREGDDAVRAAARALVWAPPALDDSHMAAIDAASEKSAPSATWEWLGARARACVTLGREEGAARVLERLLAIAQTPAPLASRGPALAAARDLAMKLGDGEAAKRFETLRRSAAERLRSTTPPDHEETLASIAWMRDAISTKDDSALAPAQIAQLETIIRSLGTRDGLRPLLLQVLDSMVLWVGVERGLLLLRAPNGKLVARAARNLAREDLRGEQLTLSMTLAKRAMESGDAVVATDAFATMGDVHASVHALRLRSVLAVPLLARGETLGVVYLDDRGRRGAFGPRELSWVRLLASQAAMAIADARDQVLLRRSARRAERARRRIEELLAEREAELAATQTELSHVRGDETRFKYDAIAGRSEPMRTLLRVVDRVTTSDVPVLVVGESGTGKELVARAMHQNGPRSKRPFVSENCGAVPESLLESTLFGHVRGAFTGANQTRAGLFEVADGGTLFLDEIGEMPLAMQTKLLRVLQDGEIRAVGSERTRKVNVRLIAATHRDLEAMVAKRAFREDLYYRLNVVTVRMPPLRERRSDIPLVVAYLLKKHAGSKKVRLTKAAMDRLVMFSWPGNVRQLENEVRRALVMCATTEGGDDAVIDAPDLSPEILRGELPREIGLDLRSRVDALEADLLREALTKTQGNQTKAAELLGLSRFGLQKMMRRLKVATSKPS